MKKMISLCLSAILTTAVFLTSGLLAGEFPVITPKELKAKMDSGETLFLLNPLSDIEFNQAYIPGSVNIPLHTIMTTDKLPQDKKALIITYCLGPR
ncbi:MAG: hypothetical protein GY795_22725 [Desulfobacterales bacterium]|nr:hypothetical protein [Desulfobacterales bacterium]